MVSAPLIFKHKQQGFTLLEVMLVFLLMSMVSVGVIMTLPSHTDSQDDMQWQAQRFNTLILFAEDEAMISGLDLGLVFGEKSYQFAFYDTKTKSWLPVVNKQFNNKVELPEDFFINFSLSGITWDELDTEERDDFIDDDDLVSIEGQEKVEPLKPQVYLMASGEVTPFSVDFSSVEGSSNEQSVTVSVSMTGAVTFSESQ